MADDARISTALPRHPKTVKLQRQLEAPGCWSLVCLFLWVAENRPDGDLRGMSAEDIEIAANWSQKPGDFVRILAEVRFLDGEEAGYRIHDWAEHNPYVASRPQRVEAARLAAAARWRDKTLEQRTAAGRQAARARWKQEAASGDELTDACAMRADITHDACGMHAPCVPPSLPHTSIPLTTTPKAGNAVALPDWIPSNAWSGFVEMRKRVRAATTGRAVQLLITRLAKLRDQGEDVGAVLDQSTENSWKSVFPTKRDHAMPDRHTGFAKRDYTAGLIKNADGSYS